MWPLERTQSCSDLSRTLSRELPGQTELSGPQGFRQLLSGIGLLFLLFCARLLKMTNVFPLLTVPLNFLLYFSLGNNSKLAFFFFQIISAEGHRATGHTGDVTRPPCLSLGPLCRLCPAKAFPHLARDTSRLGWELSRVPEVSGRPCGIS